VTVIHHTPPSTSRPLRFLAALLGLCALGAAAGGLPLLEAPGYELGQAGALLAALLLAPWLGLAAARRELSGPAPSPLAAWAAASARAAALLLALLLGSAARALLGPCQPLAEAALFPVLALPSALLGCALAVAAGFAARGRGRAGALLYAFAVLLLLAFRLRQAYRGPEAFLLDPLLGYLPGPLYDEAVPLDARLLLARGEALGWAALVAGAAGLLRALRRAGRPSARTAAATAALGACLVAATALPRPAPHGGPALRAAIERALGGRREGARCTVSLPAELPAATADEYLAECEFHASDVAALLGVTAPPHVTLFVYRSAEEKRRWVGAAHTDYTKPWLAEIHLTDQPLPHPVLRHELVHAVASVLAPGPLHLPARGRLLPSLALVEGLAVALETPRGGATVHEWSRAARDLGQLPDLPRILGPGGFWGQAPARAYTAAGSFLADLLARHGPAPIAAAYRDGDLAAAYRRPLPELVTEWQRSLDQLPPRPDLAAAAAERFGRGSLFERRCARESAARLRDASAAAAAGRTAEACGLYDLEAERGGAADALERKGAVLGAAGALDQAEAAYRAAAAALPPDDAARRAELAGLTGDLAWRRGDVAGALAGWEAARARPLERAQARLLAVKALAAADPALGPAVRDYLLGAGGPLALARAARTSRPLADYLLGRTLLQRGERTAAAAALSRAARSDLPPLVLLEARLSLAEATCDPGEAAPLSLLAQEGEADLARLAESRRRCAFQATGVGPATAGPR
jgi:hypothetical protein